MICLQSNSNVLAKNMDLKAVGDIDDNLCAHADTLNTEDVSGSTSRCSNEDSDDLQFVDNLDIEPEEPGVSSVLRESPYQPVSEALSIEGENSFDNDSDMLLCQDSEPPESQQSKIQDTLQSENDKQLKPDDTPSVNYVVDYSQGKGESVARNIASIGCTDNMKLEGEATSGERYKCTTNLLKDSVDDLHTPADKSTAYGINEPTTSRILKHYIDGFVIEESSEPFPVSSYNKCISIGEPYYSSKWQCRMITLTEKWDGTGRPTEGGLSSYIATPLEPTYCKEIIGNLEI